MKRIVVGVDGSPGSKRALAWAVGEARARGAELVAVHAWHPQYSAGYPFSGVQYEPELYESSARELLHDEVAAADTAGLVYPVEARLVEGGAATALVEAGRDADLLVVGSRGHGGFVGLLLGSVSNQVAHHATCPVVIVPWVTDRDL